jgi:hypothetical protein
LENLNFATGFARRLTHIAAVAATVGQARPAREHQAF